ncbi:osmoprotectant ABC transporter substrate-binding protein [Jeotgalibaca sp. MA1X17-3]|uniref:osmoprotectant ABC transporter substrate-binding protein n=1 Tax=Jeotgalibaca sp. MA1X17-3 TaxID=2908211 RepID=UPI001F205DD0|nr:osmoprotectant ABC transporter substrate-binding protein [Jeotgalibaca sp. MA1X17-3]UJF15478.1 osmoprotectant ABC transporter substrate-binding protein [Jeotgalibaca sp. MA1X17-3]
MKTFKKLILIPILMLFLSACSLPGLGATYSSDGVIITGGTTTEAQVLAYVVEGMVKHYLPEVPVGLVNNLGSSTLNHQALIGGDANISAARYTGTSLTGELAQDPITEPEAAYAAVVKGFDEKFDQVWFPSYGFANTYAFLVTKDFAKENNVSKISDLEPVIGSLTAGVDKSWMERDGDGYRAFKDIYGFDFKSVYPMQIGLVYDALEAGSMDVVLGYSTDGRIASYDLIVLEDDRNLFPPYDVSPVATKEILETYPELETVLLRLQDVFTTEEIQQLNYDVDNDLVEPKKVADDFLEENNYFEDKDVVLPEENK